MDDYPYQVDTDDHCETPLDAYRDIDCILALYASEICKTKEQLIIYDPYFCEGKVVARLGELGFATVYNKKEDFYRVQQDGKGPQYDVLVTNPPYSSDHMARLIDFCWGSNKPFFLLLPNYVYTKDYFSKTFASNVFKSSFFFCIAPKKRYLYTTPKGRRQQKSSKVTSPFPTFWYCNLFRYTDKVLAVCDATNSNDSSNAAVVRNLKQLPLELAAEQDERKRKQKNSLKRKQNKDRKRQRTVSS